MTTHLREYFGAEENKDILQDFPECILDIPPENIAGLELVDKEFHKDKMYTENLKTGEVYTKLPRCITINIVGEGFNLNSLIHSEYNVVEKHLNDILSDELEIHFLNLAKVKEQEENVEHDEKKKKLYNRLRFIKISLKLPD